MSTSSPLDITTDRIRERVDRRREDWLTATFAVVSAMTDRQARLVLDELRRRPGLSVHEADLAQFTAQRLGDPLQWRHIALAGDTWQPGRGQ